MRLITALPLLAGLMLSTNLMAADATTATKRLRRRRRPNRNA